VPPVRYPERPLVGVGALVLRGNRILLIRRAAPPSMGLWSIPGGHVELGESVLEAAVRELWEEAGLEGRALGVINVDEVIKRDDGGRVVYHYVLVTVLVDAPEGEPRPGGDALEAAFFDLEEALSMPDIAPSAAGLIRKILNGQVPIAKPIPVKKYSPSD
jgi:ADP-ribose pyrophosphatase